MNYYNPNFNGYSYNQYPSMGSQGMMQTTPAFPQQYLNGKVVDSAEMVKASEVPIGGYGVFPKADFTEIYVKTWNNNGTTQIISFKPETIQPVESQETSNDKILERLKKLEEQVALLTGKNEKKEVKSLDY